MPSGPWVLMYFSEEPWPFLEQYVSLIDILILEQILLCGRDLKVLDVAGLLTSDSGSSTGI